MARLTPAAALGVLLLASSALGGCAKHGTSSAASYEATGTPSAQYRQIAEDLVQTLAAAHAPAKTTVNILPPSSFRLDLSAGLPSHDPYTPSFGWELEQALRQRGFGVQAKDTDQKTTSAPLPLTYVLDEIGKTGYRAGVCIAREWCADRLYLTDADGRLAPAGGAIRTLVVRT